MDIWIWEQIPFSDFKPESPAMLESIARMHVKVQGGCFQVTISMMQGADGHSSSHDLNRKPDDPPSMMCLEFQSP